MLSTSRVPRREPNERIWNGRHRIDTVQAAGTLWIDLGSVDDRHALLYFPGLCHVHGELAAPEIWLWHGTARAGFSLLPLGAGDTARPLALAPVLHPAP